VGKGEFSGGWTRIAEGEKGPKKNLTKMVDFPKRRRRWSGGKGVTYTKQRPRMRAKKGYTVKRLAI